MASFNSRGYLPGSVPSVSVTFPPSIGGVTPEVSAASQRRSRCSAASGRNKSISYFIIDIICHHGHCYIDKIIFANVSDWRIYILPNIFEHVGNTMGKPSKSHGLRPHSLYWHGLFWGIHLFSDKSKQTGSIRIETESKPQEVDGIWSGTLIIHIFHHLVKKYMCDFGPTMEERLSGIVWEHAYAYNSVYPNLRTASADFSGYLSRIMWDAPKSY